MSEAEKKILSDLNLNHEALEEGAKYLVEWISKQPHLPNVTDENWMKAFIIGSKSIERAKEKLDRYYTVRSKNPEIMENNRDPLSLKWDRIEKIVLLPGMTPDNHHVLFIVPPKTKEEIQNFDFMETARYSFILFDCLLKNHYFTSGQYVIVDTKHVTMEFLSKFVNNFLGTALDIYQTSLPVRSRAMVWINASTIVEKFMTTYKMFLKPKFKERVFAYSSDYTVLSKYVPLDMLPEDYGGKNPPFEKLFEMMKNVVEKEREWLITEGCQGADLSKKPKTEEDTPEQMKGTFRKLQID